MNTKDKTRTTVFVVHTDILRSTVPGRHNGPSSSIVGQHRGGMGHFGAFRVPARPNHLLLCCRKAKKEKRTKQKFENKTKYFCHFCSPKKKITRPKNKPSHQTPLHFKTATWQLPPSHVQQFVVPQERRVGEGVRTPHRHPCGSTKGSRVVAAVAIPHHQHPTVVVQCATAGTCE